MHRDALHVVFILAPCWKSVTSLLKPPDKHRMVSPAFSMLPFMKFDSNTTLATQSMLYDSMAPSPDKSVAVTKMFISYDTEAG